MTGRRNLVTLARKHILTDFHEKELDNALFLDRANRVRAERGVFSKLYGKRGGNRAKQLTALVEAWQANVASASNTLSTIRATGQSRLADEMVKSLER